MTSITLIILFVTIVHCRAVLVNITTGSLNGTVTPAGDKGDRVVSTFLSVPYAQPPVGDLRFAKPKSASPWTGIRSATDLGAACIQFGNSESPQDEDCLYLNVFVPMNLSEPLTEKKAVMVFIHGGAFLGGSANQFDATTFSVEGDVIIVTINYRLGVFGFLDAHGALPYNLGLWDQHLAMNWVAENIEYFGGDANNITIFGESAGSISVGYHLLSPHTNTSLFQRAILESGGTLNRDAFETSCESIALRLCAELGYKATTDVEAAQYIKSKTAHELTNATMKLITDLGPVIDGDYIPYYSEEMLINYTKHGAGAIKDVVGNLAKYDVLGGYNVQEGLYFYPRYKAFLSDSDGISEKSFEMGIELLDIKVADSNIKSMLASMTAAQYAVPFEGSSEKSEDQKRLRWSLDISGDRYLAWPTIELVLMHSSVAPDRKSYLYCFDHKRSASKDKQDKNLLWLQTSANHADELAFLFSNPTYRNDKFKTSEFHATNEEIALAKAMVLYWSNFAKSGNPQSERESSRGGVQWPEISESSRRFLRMKTSLDVAEVNPLNAKAQFWRSVIVSTELNKCTSTDAPPTSTSERSSVECTTVYYMLTVCALFCHSGSFV